MKQAQLDDALNQGEANVINEDELQQLRQKTRAVEEVGVRIDEAIKMKDDTQVVITRLGRYDEAIFADTRLKQLSEAKLKKQIHETSLKLEKFPRKNRHSQDWYEKYFQKFQDLK